MNDINLVIQALVWVRWAVQNWALARQTHAVISADNTEATSLAASWLFAGSSIYGCFYAVWTSAPAVYFWSSAFSVACQGFVLYRLCRRRKPTAIGATAGVRP